MSSRIPRQATLEQVAERAGVSRSAASRAINDAPYVSAATRSAVLRAVRELGYVPNAAARALASNQAGAVVLAVANEQAQLFADPFFAQIALGISAALEETDLDLMLMLAHSVGGRARLQRRLRSPRADGIMLVSLQGDDPVLKAAASSGLPLVVGGQPLHGTVPWYVDADNKGGAALAVQHLLATGRSRIATISGPQDTQVGVARRQGFCETLILSGLPADRAETGDFTRAGGASAMDRLLVAYPDIDAVFAASDNMAAGALLSLRAHGRRVPDDVAVVGFDDLPIAQHTDPELTTIQQPIRQLGQQMASQLLQAIAGAEPSSLILPTRLIIRGSAPL